MCYQRALSLGEPYHCGSVCVDTVEVCVCVSVEFVRFNGVTPLLSIRNVTAPSFLAFVSVFLCAFQPYSQLTGKGNGFPSLGAEFCGSSVCVCLTGGICCGVPDTESPLFLPRTAIFWTPWHSFMRRRRRKRSWFGEEGAVTNPVPVTL